jgi:hypothetical protein
MKIIAYLWIFLLFATTFFILIAGIIEKNVDETHPIKKWWRRNVIDVMPNDKEL